MNTHLLLAKRTHDLKNIKRISIYLQKENEQLKKELKEQKEKYLRLVKKHKKDKTNPKEGE